MSVPGDVTLPFGDARPVVCEGVVAAPSARVIGRTRVGARCVLSACATLRGDGEAVEVGDDCWFGEHATVHIVHWGAAGRSGVPTRIGARVTVGARALVHAVTVGDGAVVGSGAVLLDEAELGPGAAVAPGALVPPRKKLAGGVLYAGVPATPLRPLAEGELEALRAAERARRPDDAAVEPAGPSRVTAAPGALVCDTVEVAGTLLLGREASVWFGTRILAPRGRVSIGERSNVQDNSSLVVADGEEIAIGDRVVVGHEVALEACRIGDGALVANGARLGRGTIVEPGACVAAAAVTEPGTVVEAGMLWAGRPARLRRPLTTDERARFSEIPGVYADEYRPRYLRVTGREWPC